LIVNYLRYPQDSNKDSVNFKKWVSERVELAEENMKKLAQAKAAAEAKKEQEEIRKGVARRSEAAAARIALVGKSLGEVKTKDATYTQAKVEGANQFALTIFHSSGAATIEYPDLPSELRARALYHEGDYQLAKEKTAPPLRGPEDR
jgi:hypothetical protein